MEWKEILPWLTTAAAIAWAWAKRHRAELTEIALWGVAYVEKYRNPEWADAQLEDEALKFIREHWPLPQHSDGVIRKAIRWVCAQRKRDAGRA
jgi:hypothetical protein